jgi:hypothetical protein
MIFILGFILNTIIACLITLFMGGFTIQAAIIIGFVSLIMGWHTAKFAANYKENKGDAN